jgi:CBS domain containing-hemolysin-like protein
MTALGKIPQENDTFESSGLQVKVLKMDGKRIENIHVLDIRMSEEEENDKGESEEDKE